MYFSLWVDSEIIAVSVLELHRNLLPHSQIHKPVYGAYLIQHQVLRTWFNLTCTCAQTESDLSFYFCPSVCSSLHSYYKSKSAGLDKSQAKTTNAAKWSYYQRVLSWRVTSLFLGNWEWFKTPFLLQCGFHGVRNQQRPFVGFLFWSFPQSWLSHS